MEPQRVRPAVAVGAVAAVAVVMGLWSADPNPCDAGKAAVSEVPDPGEGNYTALTEAKLDGTPLLREVLEAWLHPESAAEEATFAEGSMQYLLAAGEPAVLADELAAAGLAARPRPIGLFEGKFVEIRVVTAPC